MIKTAGIRMFPTLATAAMRALAGLFKISIYFIKNKSFTALTALK
jgi:hypothetical protein